jgi:hypothetical protein
MPVPSNAAGYHVKCLRCRYDLREHEGRARCPECGLPAYWSIRAPQKLADYPADWLAKMAWAVRFLAAGYGLMLIIGLAGALRFVPQNLVLPGALFAIATVAQVAGMWLLSRRSGHWTEPAAPINRWLLRITPVGLLIASVAAIWIALDYSPYRLSAIRIGMLIAALGPAAIFIRLRTLARLIGDERLAEQGAVVAWEFTITAAALTVLLLVMQAIGIRDGYGGRKPDLPVLIPLMTIAAAMLLFLFWAAYILGRCIIDFGRAAKVSRILWNADALQ